MHEDAVIVVAHDHRVRITTEVPGALPYDDYAAALQGGVAAVTMELTTDNVDWDLSGNRIYQSTAPSGFWWGRFLEARAILADVEAAYGGAVRVVDDVPGILRARSEGALAVVVGTEGGLATEGDPARVSWLRQLGLRKAGLRWAFPTPFATGSSLTPLGFALVREYNRHGVVIDTTHLDRLEIAQIAYASTAPIFASHAGPTAAPWGDPGIMRMIAASGGGHGVIALHTLGVLYRENATIDDIVAAIDEAVSVVGVAHVGIGVDYLPEEEYCPAGFCSPWNPLPGSLAEMSSLTQALEAAGYTDDEIKGIMGGNLLRLYQRAWDPTDGYRGGPVQLYLCSNDSTDPRCLAAAANRGQGDSQHRVVNCLHPSAAVPGPVALQLGYDARAWFFHAIDGARYPCADGTVLAATWSVPGRAGNASFALCDDESSDVRCTSAAAASGQGTTTARAMNCLHGSVEGPVGLHLTRMDAAWRYHDIAGSTQGCRAGTTLVASWGDAAGTAEVQLCDDLDTDPICALAQANGGSGTADVRALSCLHSAPDFDTHGVVGLQLAYQDGRWVYYDISGATQPCVHGSVLVARGI